MIIKTPRELVKKFYSPEKDGITQGLLAKFMTCRAMALWFLTGLSLKETSMGLTFGTIIHAVLELAYNDIRKGKLRSVPSADQVKSYTKRIERTWMGENPRASKKAIEFLEMSLLIAEVTMPLYFRYWSTDLKGMKWRSLEGEFRVPYKLKDGRTIFLRGKRDGVFESPKLWLMENKTKSRVEEDNLVDYLPFELQVSLYLKTLRVELKEMPKGVLYNIIRRTQLRQGAKESMPEFAKRIGEDIEERPDHYFKRMEISIGKEDMEKFDVELEGMVSDFMDWFDGKSGHYRNTSQCEAKYGRCDYLSAENGVMTPYRKRDVVFSELEDV